MVKSGWIYPVNDNSTGSGACNYARVINEGVASILDDVNTRLEALPKKAANVPKMEFYRACRIALKAVVAYANRYADLAEATAAEETDPKVKAELLEIAEVCRRVPEFPARNFREAIQCRPSGSRTCASKSSRPAAAPLPAATASTCIPTTEKIWTTAF